MTKTSKTLALAALAAGGIAVAPASAQNPAFTPGDLVMGFQLRSGTGSDQTVLVRLPDTATFFRDTGGIQLNIVNIGSLLNSTFGVGAGNTLEWFENPALYFGLVGTWANTLPATLQNGDPERTLYFSKSRTAVGIEGLPSSTAATPSSGGMSTGANNIVALQQTLETGSLTGTLVKPTADANTWENFNGFSGANQATAFGAFTNGIQQPFATGAFGTFSYGSVEGALDLYRSQAANDVPGQFDEGGALRTPGFEATVTIDNAGNVSAILTPVPEPSAAILGGLGMLGLLSRRRRHT